MDHFILFAGRIGCQRISAPFDAHLVQVQFLKSIEHLAIDESWVFRPQEIKPFVVQHLALRTLEPDESSQQSFGALGDEFKLLPKFVEFGILLVG